MGKSHERGTAEASRYSQATVNVTQAPNLPSDFWSQVEIEQACREQHFGHLLKSYRELQDPVVKQSELAQMLQLTQGQISRIERNKTPITDLAKLARWSNILGIPASILWFAISNKSCTENDLPSTIDSTEVDSEGEDVRRRDLIKSVGIGAALLGASGLQPSLSETPSYRAVGMESVEIMREWTRMFRKLDNQYGGGHALSQIGHYVATEVTPKLRDTRCTEALRKKLFSAAAEIYQLAGWMSYDIGKVEQGRQCLSQALRLCHDVGNHPFAAELLAGMSHQASFLRKSDDAVDFALAAKETARKIGLHALASEAAVMAAHGLALQQNKRRCLTELQEAEAQFCRIREGESPDWLAYFDDAYLSAKFGHTLKDLGESTEAERFARRSLRMSDGYERGRMFNTALLASTLADQGKVDEAVAHGKLAVRMAGRMRSVRTTTYLTEVAERLTPFRTDGGVQGLHKQMTASKIPLQRV